MEEARGLAAERADVIDDLTARLATEDASWQAHHRAAILDLQVCIQFINIKAESSILHHADSQH